MTINNLLTTTEAAQKLRIKENTLEIWRVQGRGPKYIKLGRSVRYPEEFLNEFVAQGVRESTSQQ